MITVCACINMYYTISFYLSRIHPHLHPFSLVVSLSLILSPYNSITLCHRISRPPSQTHTLSLSHSHAHSLCLCLNHTLSLLFIRAYCYYWYHLHYYDYNYCYHYYWYHDQSYWYHYHIFTIITPIILMIATSSFLLSNCLFTFFIFLLHCLILFFYLFLSCSCFYFQFLFFQYGVLYIRERKKSNRRNK